MASRLNGFLIDAFKDRETLLASSVATHDIDELKNLVDRFAERTERLRNKRLQNNLDTIIDPDSKDHVVREVESGLNFIVLDWTKRKNSRS